MTQETGGTVRVTGTLKFQFDVNTWDNNSFTVEALVEEIKRDIAGTVIDFWMAHMPDIHTSEKFEIDYATNIIDKYNVPDPDCPHGAHRVDDDGVSRCTDCNGDASRCIER